MQVWERRLQSWHNLLQALECVPEPVQCSKADPMHFVTAVRQRRPPQQAHLRLQLVEGELHICGHHRCEQLPQPLGADASIQRGVPADEQSRLGRDIHESGTNKFQPRLFVL